MRIDSEDVERCHSIVICDMSDLTSMYSDAVVDGLNGDVGTETYYVQRGLIAVEVK